MHAILSNTGAEVLLVPHVFGSEHEEEACAVILKSFASHYPGRVHAITKPLSERELKWVIGNTDFFVGSRMHACIAALSQCIPAVGLAYSDKFLGVFQSVGMGDFTVDLRAASSSEVISRCLEAVEARHEIGQRLRMQVPSVKEAILRAFNSLTPSPKS
jgi:polysaccharide pyruvyl transferase WcaK-like protein